MNYLNMTRILVLLFPVRDGNGDGFDVRKHVANLVVSVARGVPGILYDFVHSFCSCGTKTHGEGNDDPLNAKQIHL